MFRDTHQLHVGVAHVFYVGGQLVGCLYVGIITVLFLPVGLSPGAEMHLVDGKWRGSKILGFPLGHPGIVLPLKAGNVPGDGSGSRTVLAAESVRIALE